LIAIDYPWMRLRLRPLIRYAAFFELMMDYKFSMYIEGREATPDSVVSQMSVVSPDKVVAAASQQQREQHDEATGTSDPERE
jgi:hypothetical protein